MHSGGEMISLEQERKALLKRIESMGIENRELYRQVQKLKKEREDIKKVLARLIKIVGE